jgi:hypothetical protein
MAVYLVDFRSFDFDCLVISTHEFGISAAQRHERGLSL